MGIQLWIYRSTIWIKMLIDFLLFWSQFQRLCTWQLSMGKKISWGSWWGDLSTSTSFQVPNSFWILNEVCYNFGKNILYIFIPIRHVPPSVKSEMPSVAAVSLVRDFFKIINFPLDLFLWCLLILQHQHQHLFRHQHQDQHQPPHIFNLSIKRFEN